MKTGTQKSFGFKAMGAAERTAKVKEVFASVAPKYDVMNDLMSLGIHRLWKREFVQGVAPKKDDAILDLAGGTGDIAFLMQAMLARESTGIPLPPGGVRGGAEENKNTGQSYRKTTPSPNPSRREGDQIALSASGGSKNKISICDINPAMLDVGKKRAMDRGLHGAFNWVEGNAEELPFEDNTFDIVTIAFGLRNVTHLLKALADIHRVLKPGGRFFCLEFSHMAVPLLQKIYDGYSFTLLPWLGEKVAGDRASYQYLAESIRAFPDQEALLELMREAGFAHNHYRNLSLGIAAIHEGMKA